MLLSDLGPRYVVPALARYASTLPLLTLLAGCFTYIPAPLDGTPTTEDVRVHLTRGAMAQVPEEFPTGESFLTGRLMRVAADSVVLSVPVARPSSSFGMELRQDLHLPRGGIVEVERREVNGVRTGLTVAAATGAAAALLLMIIDASGSGDADPGDVPEPSRLRLPSVSLH